VERQPGTRVIRTPLWLLAPLLALLAACGGDDAGSGDEPPTRQEIVAQVATSTVSIVARPPGENRTPAEGAWHAHGTGIVYDADEGLVLTSNHFTEDAGSIKVRVNERTEVQGRAVARAQCSDLAVLALHPKPPGLVAAKFADSDGLQEGEQMTALAYSFPPGAPKPNLVVTTGTLAAVNTSGTIHERLPRFPSLLLHQAPLEGSHSGGPLANAKGEVVGINTFIPTGEDGGDGVFSAITSNRVRELMAELGPGVGSRFTGWREYHACHGQMGRLAQEQLVSHPPNGPARHGYRGAGTSGGGHGGGHGD